jgi:hypothetical protein
MRASAQVSSYLGIVKCNQPVVAVVNSVLPSPYNGNGGITQLVLAAQNSAALTESEAPATCCDGWTKPCGGRGGPCCSSAQTCTAAGTCVKIPVCEGLGYSCQSGDDCCTGLCTNSVCACAQPGSACGGVHGACCDGYVCSAGRCKLPANTCNGDPKPVSGCSGTWKCCGGDGWECGHCI